MTLPKLVERALPNRLQAKLTRLAEPQGSKTDFDSFLDTVPAAKHAVVVLGCPPGEQMETRLNTALQVITKALKSDPHTLVVLSGGVRHEGSELTESALMKNWLETRGVPSERLVAEDFSTTTAQNAQNTAQVLKRAGVKHSVQLVTERFHSGRAHSLFVRALHQHKLDLLVPQLHVHKADDSLTVPKRSQMAAREVASRFMNHRTWDRQDHFADD